MSEGPVFDPHVIGSQRIGWSRIGVKIPTFDRLIAAGGAVLATRNMRIVSKIADDDYSGEPIITWGDDETIYVSFDRGLSGMRALRPGIVGENERAVATPYQLFMEDRVTISGQRYIVARDPQEIETQLTGFMHRVTTLTKEMF